MLLGVVPVDAADPLKASRACRTAIAKEAAALAKATLTRIDACHAARDKGKATGDCNLVAGADPKGAVAKRRAKAEAAIDKRCAPGDPVRTNYRGGLVTSALLPAVQAALEASATAIQGAPALAGDKAAAKCHAAVAKARTAIVLEILKQSAKCQQAVDKAAVTFGALAGACAIEAVKAAPKARTALAKACRRKDGTPITGPDVGSCPDLPECLIAQATATGQTLAAGIYTQPSACGDGYRDAGESCPGLEGSSGEPALSAIVTTDRDPGAPEAEIEETPAGARVARTRLEVEIVPAATVGEVNDLLGDLGAEILTAVANVPVLVVRIPDPGSLAALDTVLATARAHPAVYSATAGFFPAPDLLPDNYDVANAATDLTLIDHQLAIRAPAAWNARGALPALDGRPLVVIGDLFGAGPPDATVDAAEVVAGDFATGNLYPDGHGYHVLGIVAAAGGGAACTVPLTAVKGRACASGTFPGTIRLRVADYQAGYTAATLRLKLVQHLLLAGNAVLSTSLNDCYVGTCGNPFVAAEEGSKWARMVRFAGLEDDVLHLTSAGNIKSTNPAVIDALTNSAFSAAALSGDMVDFFGDPVAALANVLVIENARNTNVLPYAPRCLDRTSKRGGHLSGIGTDVWSLRDAAGTEFCLPDGCTQETAWPPAARTPCTVGNWTSCQAGNLTGTSMSTPQVAGLATYLWALEPTLSVAELRALLVATAVPTGNEGGAAPCDATAPQPVIDAYAAVLALDGTGTPPDPVGAPVRHAILDADGDDTFDDIDLGLFLERYFDGFVDAGSHGPLVAPASRDYGRFDLNGDGFTGGPGTVPFDLDLVGSPPLAPPVLGRVFQALDEGQGGVFFEQTGLTDLEILCYYAHSGLYQGSAETRAALLDPAWCNVIEVDARFVGYEEERLVEGEPALLRVTVVYRDATGATTPLPDVRVEIGVAGGSGDGSATTDESGVVERMVTPGGGSEDVEVTIHVRPAAGGILLAEDDLNAGVDEEDDGHEDECEDFRPDGVYLESRASIVYGNSSAFYSPPTGSGTIYIEQKEKKLRDRDDLPGASSDRYYGPWSDSVVGGASGARGGVVSSGNYNASHSSEMQGQNVAIPDPGGNGTYNGFLFQGFTYEAGAQAYVTHTNSGSFPA